MEMEMKMKSAARQRAGVLARWAAVLGLGLMSVQAPAFYIKEPLKAQGREAAFQELLGRMSGGIMDICELAPGERVPDKSSGRAVKVECGPDKQEMFIKYHQQSRADAANMTLGALKWELLGKDPELHAMIRKPGFEASFDEPGQGRGYFTVYYSAGKGALNLHDWVQESVQRIKAASSQQVRDAELEKMHAVYKQMGRFLGGAHRSGLINEGQIFDQLQTQSVAAWQGLDGFSVTVKPDGQLKIDLDALASDARLKSPSRVVPLQLERLALELAPLESVSFDDLFSTLTSIGHSLPLSYCSALEKKSEAEAVSGRCFAVLGPREQDAEEDASC